MSFEEIYKLTFKYVYRFFYYKSVNPAEIEDLAHEVYIRYYKKFSSRDIEEVEIKKILYGISNNLYKEWVRQKVKENKVELIDNYDYEENVEDFCDEAYEVRLEGQKKQLLEALKLLNEKVRTVLECRFLHGMSRKEISLKLDMKEKDVHTYQKRGIRYLNKIINND